MVKEKKKQSSEQRFIELAWKTLEYKLCYYRPELVHPSRIKELTITDIEYDMMEGEYRQLAAELGLNATAANMVDFDVSKPSCRLVMSKMGSEK